MSFDQPLVFKPFYKERIWGGRRLASDLGRELPLTVPIGESWELVDRADDQSVVADGPHAGVTLHELWTRHRDAVFGPGAPDAPRFPVLAKILDAREKLSVQVHPPARIAASLNGEPKTEMWFLLDADADAALYAGFRNGVTRESFEKALRAGTCEELLHRIPVRAGDSIFIPSGRCHAIGGGCFIIEIQQNSDTTYRVFDWNRTGSDGKPRELHIDESLASIDFNDHEPSLTQPVGETLAACEHFKVERWRFSGSRVDGEAVGALFTVTDGAVRCVGREFYRGDFFLLPAASEERELSAISPTAEVLRSVAGNAAG